jgi:hypothetical protein
MSRPHLQFVFLMGAAVVVNLGGGAAVAETPKEIIAAKLRLQGFACAKPVSAERDRAASKPNEAVRLLKCQDVRLSGTSRSQHGGRRAVPGRRWLRR